MLPDINTTIAAAMHGAAHGFLLIPVPAVADSTEEDAAAAPDPAVADSTEEDASVAPDPSVDVLGKDWNDAPPAIRASFIALARFLNSYSHGIPVANIDREPAALALVAAAKDANLGHLRLPYGVLLEVFVSTKQALS